MPTGAVRLRTHAASGGPGEGHRRAPIQGLLRSPIRLASAGRARREPTCCNLRWLTVSGNGKDPQSAKFLGGHCGKHPGICAGLLSKPWVCREVFGSAKVG